MKKCVLWAIILVALIITETSAQQKKKKRVRHEKKKAELSASPSEVTPEISGAGDVFQILEEDEAADRARADLEAKLKVLEEKETQEQNEIDNFGDDFTPDPCANKKCGPGRECLPGDKGRARCVCMKACPSEEDNRRRVCSNYNETWVSDCELYRTRCLCDEASSDCVNPLNKHLHIDYYGECREMPKCSDEEMSDFPRRMRDWLFNVMRELADRRELSAHYLQMEREAESSPLDGHRSAVAAVWKWCDLDGHPHDRVVSRHELFPIRAPLMALEHCIAPFLDSCDLDNDHRITLKEWGTCLQVPNDQLQDKCDDVANAHQNNDEGDEEV